MIPVGQRYRPRGSLDARSILSASILGVVTALLVAFLVWLWELSPVPTLFIITPLIQGHVIGQVLAFLVDRLRLRNPRLLWTLGLACGLLSVGLVHYAHYLHFLDELGADYKARVFAADDISPEKKQEMLERVANGTTDPGNIVLVAQTGHKGFLGAMLFRSQVGFSLKRVQIRGGGVWFLWGVEAIMVGWVASSMTRVRTTEPFCEDCGDWCSKRRAPIELMSDAAPTLADSVLVDDLDAVALTFTQPVDDERHKRDATRVTLHTCDHCDQTFADIEGYQIEFDGESTRTATQSYFTLLRISPEMTALLRDPVSATAVADGEVEPVIDEHVEFEGADR